MMTSAPDSQHTTGTADGRNSRRQTVAVLLDYFGFMDGNYQPALCRAFDRVCSKLGLNLLLTFGRGLAEPSRCSEVHNEVFGLIHPACADAVVAVSSVLGTPCRDVSLLEFCRSYRHMPFVSLGVALPGIPSVVLDNEAAMVAVVEHLVKVHGRRRIAYLDGIKHSSEAQQRMAGYRRVLHEHGLAFDERLVEHGDFVSWEAKTATQRLLDRVDGLDAIVAANDSMALAAIEVLRARGLGVPGDVLVTGFDDVHLSRLSDPSLTTAAQPFEELAEAAIRLVLAQIHGRGVPELTRVAGRLMVRRSCGCGVREALSSPGRALVGVASAALYLQENRHRLGEQVVACFGIDEPRAATDTSVLLSALASELAGTKGAFWGALDTLLSESSGDNLRFRALHEVINLLRREFRGVASAEVDDVWYESLDRLAHGSTMAQVHAQFEADSAQMQLMRTVDRISVTRDLEGLEVAALDSLLELGIRHAFLSRFSDVNMTELVPMVCVLDGKRCDVSSQPFDARRLIPAIPAAEERRLSLLVFPLVFETSWLGVIVLAYTGTGKAYQMIRGQIASALGSITLQRQLLEQTRLHERSVQERQATAQRMSALSLLASGVAHDLNNTLGPLLALPKIIAEDLTLFARAPVPDAVQRLNEDLTSIEAAGVRAAQTIKDLLTLGRQGRAPKEALDVNELVGNCVAQDSLRLYLPPAHRDTRVIVDLDPEPAVIRASETHVARALMNLVQNAVEACPYGGEVRVSTRKVKLAEPFSGYELIPRGHYALVSVSDSGVGVEPEVLTQIFEPFFTSKRTAERSGSGLGLAIVHGVVKEHGAFLDVESRLGRGTAFNLYFPICVESARPRARVGVTMAGPGARILVVDDDPTQRRTARRVLMHLGHGVEDVSSGGAALHQASQLNAPYDLVMMDVMLNEPEDGVQVVSRLRSLFPGLCCILMSGQAPSDAALELLSEPGVAWLQKPYTAEVLASTIADLLTRDEQRRSDEAGARNCG